MSVTSRPQLVVLRALGLGDFLTAVPALRALARVLPDHERVLLCPKALAPLVAVSGTGIDRVADADFRTCAPEAGNLPPDLGGPDLAVNLHGRGPQSHQALLALRPRHLLAHGERCSGASGPPWNPDGHEVDRWCSMLGWHGIQADPTDLRLHIEPEQPVAGRARCVVLHPGASSAARRWPAARWAELVRALRVFGHPVVVTGSAAERAVGLDIARRGGLPADRVLAGRTSALSLARVVAGAAVLIAGDSGPAHLATAVGTRSVVLFGPTSPSRWGARIDRDRHLELWRGRTGDPHGDNPHPGLLDITVTDVLAGLRELAA